MTTLRRHRLQRKHECTGGRCRVAYATMSNGPGYQQRGGALRKETLTETPLLGRASREESWELIDEEKLFERLASRLQVETYVQDAAGLPVIETTSSRRCNEDWLRALEEEVSEANVRASQAVTTARSHESTVEALSRELQARRGTSAKLLAWQADTEAWRARVEGELRTGRSNLNVESYVTHHEKKHRPQTYFCSNVFQNGKVDVAAGAAVSSMLTSLQHDVRQTLADFREELGALSAVCAPASFSKQHLTLIVENCVTSTVGKLTRDIESRIIAQLCAKLVAEQSNNADTWRRDLPRELSFGAQLADHDSQFVGDRSGEGDGDYGTTGVSRKHVTKAASVSMVLDRKVPQMTVQAKLGRESVAALRSRLEDLEEACRTETNARVLTVDITREALEQRIAALASQAASTARTGANKLEGVLQRMDVVCAQMYETLGVRHSEWKDDAAEIRRSISKHDKSLTKLSDKLEVVKACARAYAEDAPGVRRAGLLKSKFDKIEAKVSSLDDKVRRLCDIEDRCSREQERLNRRHDQAETRVSLYNRTTGYLLSNGPQQHLPEQRTTELGQVGGLPAPSQSCHMTKHAKCSTDAVTQARLKTLESQYAGFRTTVVEVLPSRLREIEARLCELAKDSNERTMEMRRAYADADAKLSETKEALLAEIAAACASISDCHETARRAAADAAHACVTVKQVSLTMESTGAKAPLRSTTPQSGRPSFAVKTDARLAAVEDSMQQLAHFQHPGGRDLEARDRVSRLERRLNETLLRNCANDRDPRELTSLPKDANPPQSPGVIAVKGTGVTLEASASPEASWAASASNTQGRTSSFVPETNDIPLKSHFATGVKKVEGAETAEDSGSVTAAKYQSNSVREYLSRFRSRLTKSAAATAMRGEDSEGVD